MSLSSAREVVSISKNAIMRQFANGKRRYALATCLLISIVLAAAFATRVASVRYAADLEVSGFTAKIGRDATVQQTLFVMPQGYLINRIDGLTSISVDGKRSKIEGPISVAFEPPQSVLSTIDLLEGSTLTIGSHVAQGATLTIQPVRDKMFRLRLVLFAGQVLVTGRLGDLHKIDGGGPPALLDGEVATPAGNVAIYMTPAAAQTNCKADDDPTFSQPNVSRLPVDEVRFARAGGIQEAANSTIISGTVRLPVVEREIRLDREDVLNLGIEKSELNFVRILPCALRLNLRGTATTVRIGSDGVTKDYRPTYLEIAVLDKDIVFVMTALASMWGFLWGLRQLLRPDSDAGR